MKAHIRWHTYICFVIKMFFNGETWEIIIGKHENAYKMSYLYLLFDPDVFYCIFSYYLNDFYIFYMLTHQEDMYNPHSSVQDILWSILHKFVEPVLMHWPGRKLREKALATAMRHIHYEDECTRYINLGAVPKVTRGLWSFVILFT